MLAVNHKCPPSLAWSLCPSLIKSAVSRRTGPCSTDVSPGIGVSSCFQGVIVGQMPQEFSTTVTVYV